jgi:peptidoglycan-associated lipoprotein
MSRASRIAALVLASALVAVVPACKKKAPQTVPEAPTPAPAAVTSAPPPAATPAPRANTDDVLSQDLDSLNRHGYLTDSFFDYNEANLRDDARTALSADADWLKRYASVQILIEGHCDERGTTEYNLALGQKRSDASREYLQSLGVDASRIKTVSYGKERPFCTDSNESCWQQNRRGHILITAK